MGEFHRGTTPTIFDARRHAASDDIARRAATNSL